MAVCALNEVKGMELFMKKRGNFIICGCFVLVVIIVGLLIFNRVTKKGYLVELTFAQVMDMIKTGEDFPLVISKTDCSHCKSYKPKLEKIAKDYGINIYYIDIDRYSEEEQSNFEQIINFGGATPTTVFLKNGKETTVSNRINGDVTSEKIISKLESNEFIK